MSGTTTITAGTSKEELPSDIDTLQQMVLTLLGQIDDLSGQLLYLKRQLFGRKSEKLDPHQRLLFENLYEQVQAKLEQQEASKPKSVPLRRNATHTGRRPLPANLPRQVIPIEPAEREKVCEICHSPKQPIGEEVTEKLDYVPASFFVKRYVRPKYACKRCEGQIAIAPLPPMPVDKGIAGEGLLSHIITSKYADHNPLNRLEGILQRNGVDIPVSTMCDWVGQCADLLAPLPQRLHQIILLSPKINTDDTTIPVQCRHRKGSTYNGYLWVYIDDRRNVVFDFTPTRSREGPIRFLGGYAGYVQADAYSGYDEFFRTSKATEVGCHAHARRKFDHALESDPVRAARFLALWGKLYDVERTARQENYTPERLLHARQTVAKPVLAEIHVLLKEYQPQVLPQSPTGKAITYSLNQWPALLRYADDPILAIDNNLAERMLRMVVIGRKNYLFAGSETGARRAAILYSLIAACKLNQVDPFAYFRDVLGRISTHPASRIDELLPGEWKKSHPATLPASPTPSFPATTP